MKSALRLAAIVPEKILLGAHFTRHYQFEHVIGVARSIADTALAVLDLPHVQIAPEIRQFKAKNVSLRV